MLCSLILFCKSIEEMMEKKGKEKMYNKFYFDVVPRFSIGWALDTRYNVPK